MGKHYIFQKQLFSCLAIVICCILTQQPVFSQPVKKASLDGLIKKYADSTIHPVLSEQPYFIITWQGKQPENVTIARKLDEEAAIIRINSEADLKSLKQSFQTAPANNYWKLSPAAEEEIVMNSSKERQYILSFDDADILITGLQKYKRFLSVLSVNKPTGSAVILSTPKVIKEKLLSLKEVIFIDVKETPHTEIGIIGYNRSFHGINAVDYSIAGANGKNIVAGVKEQKMNETDLDLYKRVLPSIIASGNITNHATVVSSIIGGAGNSFYDGRGIASGCKFFPSSFDNLFADDATLLNSNKVSVQNHSYGTVIQQFYGAEALSYDAQTWQNKNIVHVFSAGNSGTSSASTGPYANINGYANITGNFKMAKNIITVGAIDNKENIPEESSSGPLYDGRIAPQLMALGPNGTSDAAAIVSGTAAVLQQVYADSNSQVLPPASLIKAILYNSAEEISGRGIDYKTGYGLLNSFASIKALQQKKYDKGALTQSQVWTKNILVPDNISKLKITLAWTDTTATLNNNRALVNDLDLEVKEINSGIVYKPWVLNATAQIDSLKKSPTRGRDSLNTAEQVSIDLPVAGTYQIKVLATSLSTPLLQFHIAYNEDTLNTFTFISPLHTSDVNRVENPELAIRWKTFVADTNQTGILFISYNNRTDWQQLTQPLKIYLNKYHWPIKDTSTIATLKMETSFGTYFSNDFIITKVTRPGVDFNCADSFRLSWNKHIYASAYRIYTLSDSAYLKPILIVSDTFAVLRRSLYPSLVYAVEPVLSNNLPAARSIAQNITLQGVKCFYNTFYYSLQDQNKLNLVLELSIASYVDSILFEQVTSTGQWLQTWGQKLVTSSSRIYQQLVNEVPPGTSYWRARIKLKSGAILDTEIINVLTSGKKYILFYPNPVDRNSHLNYILQQGISPSSQLQLFDIYGRLLKNFSYVPDKIDISAFVRGIIIYKLISNDNIILETGKFVIQ